MNKKMHKLKIVSIFFLLCCSLISIGIFCPIVEAGPLDPLYECTPYIEIDYNHTLMQQLVIPYDQPTEIPLTIKARITGAAADIVEQYISDQTYLIVHLSVENIPEGCHASINPPFVAYAGISTQYQNADATLSFTIDTNVPAFSLKTVVINVTVESLRGKGVLILPGATLVQAASYSFKFSFIAGYLSELSFSYPEKNVKDISPAETAVFPIEIENWGNAQSNIKIEVKDIPEGWQASIVENLNLATRLFDDGNSGAASKSTISLQVKPPIDFGYREDRGIIIVKMTPTTRDLETLYLEGEPHYLYFIVQSKGVSTALPETSNIIILVFISILIIIFIWKSKKYYDKQNKGGKQ